MVQEWVLHRYDAPMLGELLQLVFICNYLFDCRLEFKNVVLGKIFGGKMEQGVGENSNKLLKNEICGACETFQRNENYIQYFIYLKAVCSHRLKE